MSACDCPCGDESSLLHERGPHTARTMPRNPNHHHCPCCEGLVQVGQQCYDLRWIYPEDQTGCFMRVHAECYQLLDLFSDRVCGGCWRLPFDLVEAAEHAVAHADESYWRVWLDLYERTWAFSPEPPDPSPTEGYTDSSTGWLV